jgi:hypothetical protein
MKSIKEFIAWCEQHKDERFWSVVDTNTMSIERVDALCLWRNAIRDNTTTSAELFKIADIITLYKQGCELFSQAEFDQDLTQYFKDNYEHDV